MREFMWAGYVLKRLDQGPSLNTRFHVGSSANFYPTFWFVIAAMLFLGTAAFIASTNMISDSTNKDIWQHVAAVRALMDNLTEPRNPFVLSDETSRHFHPLWVGMAALANAFGVSVWGALTIATYVSMGLFALAIFLFSRACLPSPWTPLVLLVTFLFAWIIPIQHTGMHSIQTLSYAAVYPATFMMSFSLILWAVIIHALEQKLSLAFVTLLVAIMFTTHQLGAVIGLIGAGCFILLWPGALLVSRVAVSVAILIGLGFSLFWPYYNPLMLMLQAGKMQWNIAHTFYSTKYVTFALFPAIFGMFGLWTPRTRPLMLALAVYFSIFLMGFSGLDIAGRFLMPVVMVLHIGLAVTLLGILTDHTIEHVRRRRVNAIAGVTVLACFVLFLATYDIRRVPEKLGEPHMYGSALALTRDLPDNQEVGALIGAAFVVAATGKKVLFIPWPEPGISDLAQRETAVNALFDVALSQQQRRSLAKDLGVRTLIADTRFIPEQTLTTLSEQSVQNTKIGDLQRFDLFD